jgi:cytidylate kinase
MKVAIYGHSCAGKTTLSDELASRLGVRVWHCGENVKQRAVTQGYRVDALPLSVHRELDGHTRDFAIRSAESVVFEGVFLDSVLADIGDCRFIKLVCSTEERIRRHELKSSGSSLLARDESDLWLRAQLYDGAISARPDLELDTTQTNTLNLAIEVSEWLSAQAKQN